jgi:hypothetical protein
MLELSMVAHLCGGRKSTIPQPIPLVLSSSSTLKIHQLRSFPYLSTRLADSSHTNIVRLPLPPRVPSHPPPPPHPSSRAVGRRSLCTQRHILIASNIAIASSLALLIPGQRFSARLVCYSSRSKASSSKASNGSSSSTSSVASVTIIRGETMTPHTPIRSSMLIFRRTDPETVPRVSAGLDL